MSSKREREAVERVAELESLLRDVDECFRNLAEDDVHISGDLPSRVRREVESSPIERAMP